MSELGKPRVYATLPEQVAMKALLDLHTVQIGDNERQRRFVRDWSFARVAREVNANRLNINHAISVARAYDWTIEAAPEAVAGGIGTMRAQIAELERRLAEVEKLVAPLR